jgi:GR25 family glycosyltransferase involved in LPS biosynthesis
MKDFWKLFDRIYVINIPSRSDRLQSIEDQMKSLAIPEYTRKDGIIVNAGVTLKDREAGCKAAHLNIIREAKELGLNRILIFEDDTVFESNAKEVLQKFKEFIAATDYDIFYLGANVFEGHYYCLHAYIVNKQFYDKMLSYESVDKPIDVSIAEGLGNFLCANPRIAYQRSGYSDIQKTDIVYDKLLREGK